MATIGSSSADAASLNELRASGAIGEKSNGFAVVRKSAPGASRIVSKVNAKRRGIYRKRAKQQGVSAASVGVIYAKEIHRNAPAGTWLQSSGGSWSRK